MSLHADIRGLLPACTAGDAFHHEPIPEDSFSE